MERMLKGIAIILFSMLCTIGFGGAYVYHFDFRWSAIFAVLGFVGLVIALVPPKKKK